VSWSSRRGGRQTIGARGVCGSALKLPHRWAGLLSDKWCAEPRSEPDSGNPTVRDRRAALRNVASHAYGDLVRALNFEPDNRTHGSTGGDWKRNATASPRQPPTQPRSRNMLDAVDECQRSNATSSAATRSSCKRACSLNGC
jgi:hypothetical protein